MRYRFVSVVVLLLLLAGCNRVDLVAAAETAADDACACSDLACARSVVAEFNEVSFTNDDRKDGFSDEQRVAFDSAVDRMSECRDALR